MWATFGKDVVQSVYLVCLFGMGWIRATTIWLFWNKGKKYTIFFPVFDVLPDFYTVHLVESGGWQMKQKHHCIFSTPLISICVVLINLCMFPRHVCVLWISTCMNHLSQYHICIKLTFLSHQWRKMLICQSFCFKNDFILYFFLTVQPNKYECEKFLS